MPVTANLPNGYAVTVGTANQLVAPVNPARTAIMFFNNSAGGQSISICPASQSVIASGAAPAIANAISTPAGVVGAAIQGVPGTNAPGSITLVPGQSFELDTMACGCAWNGLASAAGAALTVLES